jgi:GDP-D-mannose dehydratase
MTLQGLRITMYNHLVRCGLRQVEHLTESNRNRIRKSIPLCNGFRKHVISTFIEAELNHEIRELISDHDTHLDQNYYRPTEDQVLGEYLKAEQKLTIDPTLEMQQEIQTLRVEKSKMQKLEDRMAEFDCIVSQFIK